MFARKVDMCKDCLALVPIQILTIAAVSPVQQGEVLAELRRVVASARLPRPTGTVLRPRRRGPRPRSGGGVGIPDRDGAVRGGWRHCPCRTGGIATERKADAAYVCWPMLALSYSSTVHQNRKKNSRSTFPFQTAHSQLCRNEI